MAGRYFKAGPIDPGQREPISGRRPLMRRRFTIR